MKDKQDLFSKLDDREKSNILNDKNTKFLKSFYNNYEKKEELLGLMNQNTIKNLYSISGIKDRSFISNHLFNSEQNLNHAINQNINNINKETQNINKYNHAINNSKGNINNLKNEKKEIKLNIKNSKVTIKQLEKRKKKLEEILTNTILNQNSRISFISKKRLEKIQRITNEINLTDISINRNEEQLRNYEQKLNTVETEIGQERRNIKNNKTNISLASQNIESYARQMYNSRVQIKNLSSFHKDLVGKKVYNHNKNNIIMTTSKAKTNALANLNTMISNQDDNNAKSNDNVTIKSMQPRTSKVSQNQKKLEEEFNGFGITYHPEEYVANTQVASYLPPQQITSMTYNQAKMMQLYFEAEYAKKMIEIAKLQQQMAMGGRSRTLSKAGFANSIVLILSLSVLTLLGTLLLLIFRG